MKQTVILIAVAAFVWACGSTTTKTEIKQGPRRDSVVALYALGGTEQYRISEVSRYIHDTIVMKIVDSSNGKLVAEKKSVRDTIYFVPIVDTVRPIKLDSLGHPTIEIKYYPLAPIYILADYNKSLKDLGRRN